MKNSWFNYLTIFFIIVTIPFAWNLFLILNLTLNVSTYIGLILGIPSLVFFLVARVQLGSSFQVSAEAHTLVTRGIYKKFRHPIYYFGTLYMFSVILIFQVYYMLIVLIPIILMQKRRIKKEEKVLEESFGEEYRIYKMHTWL